MNSSTFCYPTKNVLFLSYILCYLRKVNNFQLGFVNSCLYISLMTAHANTLMVGDMNICI